jgi:hypothetical protein
MSHFRNPTASTSTATDGNRLSGKKGDVSRMDRRR